MIWVGHFRDQILPSPAWFPFLLRAISFLSLCVCVCFLPKLLHHRSIPKSPGQTQTSNAITSLSRLLIQSAWASPVLLDRDHHQQLCPFMTDHPNQQLFFSIVTSIPFLFLAIDQLQHHHFFSSVTSLVAALPSVIGQHSQQPHPSLLSTSVAAVAAVPITTAALGRRRWSSASPSSPVSFNSSGFLFQFLLWVGFSLG